MMLSWGLIYGTNSHIYDHLSMRQNWNFDFWFQYLVSWFQYLIFQNQVLLNSLSEWPGSYVLISSYLFVLYFCLFFFRLFTSTFESILHWGLSAASLAPPWEGTIISLDLILERRLKEGVLGPALGKGSTGKKTFSFGHCPNDGGGVYPCPNFLALFLKVHFWSIKRVYFFKNANVLNF